MPTDVFTFPSADTTMRYRQSFTTEGLNQKNFALMPHGIYRGFQLELDSGAGERTVNIAADPVELDNLAVVNTAAGFSLTLRHASDVLLDLSSYSAVTVVVGVFGSYAVGATTANLIRVFTLAEYDALAAATRDELVVLGTVVVPVSGVIVAASISDNRRTQPFMRRTPGHVEWTNIIPNGYFGSAEVGSAVGDFSHAGIAAGWDMAGSAALSVSVEASSPAKGANSLEFALNTAGTPTESVVVTSLSLTHVTPGKRFRFRFQYDILATITAGTAVFSASLIFYNAAGGITSVPVLSLSTFAAPTGGYVQVDEFIEVPVGSVWGGVLSIVLTQTAATWDVAPSIRMDDFQLLVEPIDPTDSREDMRELASTRRLIKQEWIRPVEGSDGSGRILTVADNTAWSAGGSTNIVKFLRALQDAVSPSQAVISAEALLLGDDIVNEARAVANDKFPMLRFNVHNGLTTNYKLILEGAVGAAGGRGRMYLNNNGQFVFTSGCFWDSATSKWATDLGGDGGAFKMTLGEQGLSGEASGRSAIQIQFHNAFGTPWDDVDTLAAGDWDYQLFFESSDAGPTIRQRGRSLLGFSFNGPGQVADIHTCKAWAIIDKASLAAPTIITGNGIASVSNNGNQLVVTLSNTMRDAFYYIGITEESSNEDVGVVSCWDKAQQTTTAFRLDARDTFISGAIAGWSAASTTVLRIFVMVIGQQV